jgi:hypothetical protein
MQAALARQVHRQRFATSRLAVGGLNACGARALFVLGLLGAAVALRHAFLQLGMKVSLPCKFDNADPSVQALLDDPQLLGGRSR